jgi:pimeloyl-ACP methyl ester carboxylesterase
MTRLGEGPPVVLISGGSTDRSANAGLAEQLADRHTVYNYERRGRGDSGDTQPYAIEREVEDIAAVIGAAGGSAHLYGTSSGAALAIHAAAAGLPVVRLALWEPPYNVNGRPGPARRPGQRLPRACLLRPPRRRRRVLHGQGRGMPPEFVAQARQAPWWPRQEALAHTLAYDATIMGDYTLPTEIAKAIGVPTLIVVGGSSFGFLVQTADALAGLIPDARRATIEGQPHNIDPAALAPVLKRFFAA